MLLKNILKSALLCCVAFSFAACDDDLNSESIFDDKDEVLDPASYSYQLDKFLADTYLAEYNLQFRYKMQDVGADMNYNLVPATYANSIDLAVLTKYLWFEVYDVCAGPQFLKTYGPRILHLIGSPAYNPFSGTMILGLAEGGLKVTLFKVNTMNVHSFENLNEFYFKTMHHEFSHILHQTKTYPKEFAEISTSYYDPLGWQDRNEKATASLGFTSNYASSEPREDFAETIANFITMTDARWNQLLDDASQGWEPIEDEYGVPQTDAEGKPICKRVEDFDGVDGKAVILQKVEIIRQWFASAWGLDLDKLRAEVQFRQKNYNIEELRKQVYDIPVENNTNKE